MSRLAVAVTGLALGLLTACSSGSYSSSTTTSKPANAARQAAPAWPAPADPMGQARKAGLVPETAESLTHHVHAHLDVFVDGRPVMVPAGIGIDIHAEGVHKFGSGADVGYGGISVPCSAPCISPLHTHDTTGIVHTESSTQENNTLGQFFTEWSVRFDGTCVATYCTPKTPIAIYADGRKVAPSRASALQLTDHLEVAVVIGTPPNKIPATADFSAA